MNSYSYPQNRYMNRAERRKNGIKSEKKTYKKCHYTTEELERIIRKELHDLINEPYSETIKKERYRRLQPLIEEYNRQKENLKSQTKKTVSHLGKETDRMVDYRTKKAIAAYQKQVNYVSNRVSKAKTVNKKAEKVEKKGFFRRILDAFKPEPVAPKQTLRKPEPTKIHKTYRKEQEEKKVSNDIYDDICNEFEKQLKNFQNYSQDTIGYQYYKNGRQVKYEPRCL